MRSLERDVFPAIGKFPIAELTPPMILKVLRAIETRGSLETAKHIRQRISAVFVYAIAEGFATSNPAAKLGAVLKPLRKGRQPPIPDLEQRRQLITDPQPHQAPPGPRPAPPSP